MTSYASSNVEGNDAKGLFPDHSNNIHTHEEWTQAISKVIDQIYNSSAAAIPSPTKWFGIGGHKSKSLSTSCPDNPRLPGLAATEGSMPTEDAKDDSEVLEASEGSIHNTATNYDRSITGVNTIYNDDFYDFRRSRGENIMFRMHKHFVFGNMISLTRLARGVFACQKVIYYYVFLLFTRGLVDHIGGNV